MNTITAFLNPDVKEEIYVQFPDGLTNNDTQIAFRLKKSIYRVKQALILWSKAVDRTVQRLKFTRCKSDPCLYVRLEQDEKGNILCPIIAIYINDLILPSISSYIDDRSWFLGIQVTQGKDSVMIF
jgi:hypothetical protein